MTRNNNRLPEGDDGHVVADMNVDGMPWYSPRKKNRPESGQNMLSEFETRIAMWGALKAALLVCAVFCAGIILFVLFCLKVWFRV